MYCTLQLDGVPLGQVELTGAPRAVGLLNPLEAYSSSGFRDQAKRLGLSLRLIGSRRITGQVVARALTGALVQFRDVQSRLSLIDLHGDHITIVQIVVAEFPADNVPVVVAELREQAAPIAARLASVVRRGTGSARPAA